MVWGTLAVLAASVVISALLAPRIPDQEQASLSDFGLPTAESSRAVSVVFGTVMVQGPNIVWAGDFEADPIRVTTGLKVRGLKISKRRATVGYRYFAGIHFVVSHTVERLLAVFVDEDLLTLTDTDINATYNVDERDRFGGEEGSGGLEGDYDVMMGYPDQGANAYLQTQVNFVPGYRGFLSVVLNRFYLGNNPRFPPWQFLCQRVNTNLRGEPIWYPERAAIPSAEGTEELQRFIDGTDDEGNPNPTSVAAPEVIDLNPAHIIYSVLTELMGIPAANIDDDLFRAAADTLFEEEFGLSYVWDDADSFEDFLRLVVDHIDATLHVDPISGLWGLYLIRTVTDEEVEIAFDESNCVLDEFNREGYGELYSEIDIKSVNRFTGKEIGIRETNQALARIQGGPNGTEQTFAMAFDLKVRRIIASRNRLFHGVPKCHGTLETDHSKAYPRRVGEAILISSRKYGFQNLKARITQIDFRQFTDMRAQIEWIQDYREADSIVPFTSGDNSAQEIEIAAADPSRLFNALPVPFNPLQMHWGFLREEDLDAVPFQSRLIMADDNTGAPHIGFRAFADGTPTIEDGGFSEFYEVPTPSPRGDSWLDDNHINGINIPRDELELGDELIVQMVLLPPIGSANQIHRSEVLVVANLDNYPVIGVRRGAYGSAVIAKPDPLEGYGAADEQFFLMAGVWLPQDVSYDSRGSIDEVHISPFTQLSAVPASDADVIEYSSMPVSWYYPPASLTIDGDKWPIFANLFSAEAEISFVMLNPYSDISASVTDDQITSGISAPLCAQFIVEFFVGSTGALYEEEFTGSTANIDTTALAAALAAEGQPQQDPAPLVEGAFERHPRVSNAEFLITLRTIDKSEPTATSQDRRHVVRSSGWGAGWGTPAAAMFLGEAAPEAAEAANTIPTGFDYTLPATSTNVELGPRTFRNSGSYVTYGFTDLPVVTDDGAYYFEWQHSAAARTDNGSIGIILLGTSLPSWLGSTPQGIGIYDDGEIYLSASIAQTVPFTIAGRVGAALIINGQTRSIQYYMDGVAVGDPVVASTTGGIYVPAATGRNNEVVDVFVEGDAAHSPAGTVPWPAYQDPPIQPPQDGTQVSFTSPPTNERFIY